MGSATNGTEVEILRRTTGEAVAPDYPVWYEVRSDDVEGFVYGRLVEIFVEPRSGLAAPGR